MIETILAVIALISVLSTISARWDLAAVRRELHDETRHGRVSESLRAEMLRAFERAKKVNGALLDVSREHKKKRDMYRHQLREANRRIRELNNALDAKNEALQPATSGPARPNPYMLKVGG